MRIAARWKTRGGQIVQTSSDGIAVLNNLEYAYDAQGNVIYVTDKNGNLKQVQKGHEMDLMERIMEKS